MRSRSRATVAAITSSAFLAVLLAAAGCRRDVAPASPPVNDEPPSQSAVVTPSSGPRDQSMGEIARRVPGFAGMYYDEAGDFIVLLTARGEETVARRELEAWMRSEVRTRYGPERAATVQFLVRRAEFEYMQLEDWKIDLIRNSGDLPMTSGIGLDHKANRVTVWVASSPADTVVWRRAIAARGVPDRAVWLGYRPLDVAR